MREKSDGTDPRLTRICREVLDFTADFLDNEENHNAEGLRNLVERRRTLLAGLADCIPPGKNGFNDEYIQTLWEEINLQDKRLERVVRGLQGKIMGEISRMKRIKKAARSYLTKRPKQSIFFDKKS